MMDSPSPVDDDPIKDRFYPPPTTIEAAAYKLELVLRSLAIEDGDDPSIVHNNVGCYIRDGVLYVSWASCPEKWYHGGYWPDHACDGFISCPNHWHCEAADSESVIFVSDLDKGWFSYTTEKKVHM